MAKRKRKPTEIEDYRHDATRKNIPPAGLAAHGRGQGGSEDPLLLRPAPAARPALRRDR